MAGPPIEKKRDMDQDREWLIQVLTQLQYRESFGTLTIKMEHGQIRRVERKNVQTGEITVLHTPTNLRSGQVGSAGDRAAALGFPTLPLKDPRAARPERA